MVNRTDEPTYQCTKCYKPWFNEDFNIVIGMKLECPHCGNDVRKITEHKLLITD